MKRAKKSLFTALFAVLVVAVLVPTMAFAANIASWGDKYASVTDTDGKTFTTERTFGSDGIVKADPQDDTSVVGGTVAAPSSDAYFYDLDGSQFVYGTGDAAKKLDGTTWTQEAFKTLQLGVQVVEPSYVKDYDAKKAAHKEFAVSSNKAALTNWTIEVKQSEYTEGSTEDQTVTFEVKSIDPTNAVDATNPATPDLEGTVATATITVKGVALTPDKADFYLDSADSYFKLGKKATLTGYYDGAEHTVVADEVPGYTLAYTVYNTKTGKYEAADAVKIKDVADPAVKVKATFTKTADKTTVTREFTVNLEKAKAKIGFDNAASKAEKDADNLYYVDGAEYNAMDYIVITPDSKTLPKGEVTDEQKAEVKAYNDANKAAVAANEAEILKCFNDLYEITATPSKAYPDDITLKIEEKSLTAKEKAAIEETYAGLMANMTISEDEANTQAMVILNSAELKADGVYFTEAPNVTVKAKKLKKKAKTFAVSAVANSGKAVTYKIDSPSKKITINSETGKVKIAKKLKKGTYKVKVYAYTEAGQGYAAAHVYEPAVITIKVKK